MRLDVPTLADDLIALRPPAERDVDAITVACQDADIPRFTRIRHPYTRADAVEFVKRANHQWRTGGDAVSFAVTDLATDALLGAVGLVRLDDKRHVVEIGYWVAPDARRRGVATRAVVLLSRWAISEAGFERIELMTRLENVGSQGVAAAAGFTREGVLRAYVDLGKGGRDDVVMFSLLRRDLA